MMYKKRCSWVPLDKPDYVDYHDFEWGIPVHDDNKHFEMLIASIKRLPKDYLIFFGGGDTKVPNHFFLEKGCLVKHKIATAEAYLIDLANIKRRMLWLKKHRMDLPADHLIAHIDCDLHHANSQSIQRARKFNQSIVASKSLELIWRSFKVIASKI